MPTLAMQLAAAVEPTTEQKWGQDVKLAAASSRLRLPELLALLTQRGWQPSIAYTWRSLRTQAHLRAKGWTKVSFSLHNVVDAAGKPAAYAADIFDRRYGWEKPDGAAGFFKALGQAAGELGLEWGGAWSRSDPHWAPYGLGWDPGHVQLAGFQDLEPEQARCLPLLLGAPYPVRMSDGYSYQIWVWPQGGGATVEITASPRSRRRTLLLPGVDDEAIHAILVSIWPELRASVVG